MQTISRLLQYTVNSLDISSGANDVIVIKRSDGTLKSTFFQVRFGKGKVFRPSDKIVQIEVNGEMTDAVMKIGSDGIAFWLEPCQGNQSEQLESPIQIPTTLPDTLVVNPFVLKDTNEKIKLLEEKNEEADLYQSVQSDSDEELSAQEKTEPAQKKKMLKVTDVTPESSPRTLPLYSFSEKDTFTTYQSELVLSTYSKLQEKEGFLLTQIPCDEGKEIRTPPQVKNNSSFPLDELDEEEEEYAEDIEFDEEDFGTYEAGERENISTKITSSFDEETKAHPMHYKQTLTPLSADLSKLNLKDGMNVVRYITLSSIRGTVVEEGRIYLWPPTVQCVVSDVDGTITRSDVLGHLLPMVGKDWTHAGICDLYTKIAHNGYHFIYLTARSASLLAKTRKFLWGIEQNGKRLPMGPLMMAPDRFFAAFAQEMTRRSYEFKISALESVLNVFPLNARPLYAGFGNRIGDAIAYTVTEIPEHKIFIIDDQGVIHVCHVKHSYKNLSELVHETFPALKSWACVKQYPHSMVSNPHDSMTEFFSREVLTIATNMEQEAEHISSDFNNFNFWKINPLTLIGVSSPEMGEREMGKGGSPSTTSIILPQASLPNKDGGKRAYSKRAVAAGYVSSWFPWKKSRPSKSGGEVKKKMDHPIENKNNDTAFKVSPAPSSAPIQSREPCSVASKNKVNEK